jgi:lipopolysaccharide export system protein LptA
VFVDDVVLDHPDFHLTADELEVFMLPEDPAKSALPVKNGVGGNLKRAIAKGRKVIITRQAANGEVQTGWGREAVYDGATGDILLRGWPQIQKRNNLTVATEPTTYFIIKANGNFHALGGHAQTRIVQESDK